MMDPCLYTFIDKLEAEHTLYASEWQQLLDGYTPRLAAYLFEKSRRARIQFYGHDVYIRGLIEFTNYCRNNCYYCGIRSGNTHVHRYRLTKEEILSCCETGYELGFGLSSCRAVKTPIIQPPGYLMWCIQSGPLTRTARSPFPLERPQRKSTSSFLMPEPTVFFCAMKLTTQSTIRSCIRHSFLLPTDSNASGI